MKTHRVVASLVLGLGLMVCPATTSQAAPMGTGFTYQGRLNDAGQPANGSYDLNVGLYGSADSNDMLSLTSFEEVQVVAGLFTVQLDFGGNVFNGDARWLEIGVRPGDSSGSFTTLSPRQELTPTPYALQTRGIFVDDGPHSACSYNWTAKESNRQWLSAAMSADGSRQTAVDCGEGSGGGQIYVSTDSGNTWIATTTGFNTRWRSVAMSADGTKQTAVAGAGGQIYVCSGIVDGYRVGIGTVSPQGKLDVNGAICQRGGLLYADYVFEPDYALESIDKHSEFMWQHKHLAAIPKSKVDENGREIIEVGAHRRGIVEELEKAHIYIEQLHKRIKDLTGQNETIEACLAAFEACAAKLTVSKEGGL